MAQETKSETNHVKPTNSTLVLVTKCDLTATVLQYKLCVGKAFWQEGFAPYTETLKEGREKKYLYLTIR